MIYVFPYRRLAGWFFLLVSLCSLASPVEALVIAGSPTTTVVGIWLGGSTNSEHNVYVGGNWVCYFLDNNGNPNGQSTSGTFSGIYKSDLSTLSGGLADAASIGAPIKNCLIYEHETVSGGGAFGGDPWSGYNEDNAGVPQNWNGDSDGGIPSNPGSAAPSNGAGNQNGYNDSGTGSAGADPTTGQPINGDNNGLLSYTNTTGGIIYTPSGGEIPPGGVVNYPYSYPIGSFTNLTFTSQNPYGPGSLNDGGATLSGLNGASGLSSSNYINPPSGMNGGLLKNGAGGPIYWDPTTITNTQSAVEAGASAIAAQIALQDTLLSNLLSRPLKIDVPSNSASGGGSNVWVMNWPSNFNNGSGGTNVFNGTSNVWVQNWPWTNNASNVVGDIVTSFGNTLTNTTGPLFSSLVGGGPAAIEGGIPSSISDDSGGDNLGDITIGNPGGPVGTLAVSLISFPSGMQSFYSSLRGLIAWCLIVGSLLWNFQFAFNCMSEVLRTNGVKGMSTGPLTDQFGGWAVVGIAISGFILSMLVTIPTTVIGGLTGEISFVGNTSSPSQFFGGAGVSLQWVDQVFPVWVLVSTAGAEIFFFFSVRVYCLVIQSALRLLPGS